MRILYGVVGEGMGHAIRSRVVLEHLLRDHQVHVVVSGRAHDYLAKHFQDRLGVTRIWGLSIVAEDNEVRNFATLLENLKGAVTGGWPRNVKAYYDVAREFRPDCVISDFETWSYLFGRNHMLPIVSIDNMQVINRCVHPPEILAGHEPDFQLAKGIVKAKVPGSYHYLVSTFFHPELRKKRTSLHPPILRPEILAAGPDKVPTGEHLLVYQSYTTNTELPEILARSGVECRIYGVRRELEAEEREGNLRFLPFSEGQFIDDLRTARGVIAGGGFTLMGEAVYLRRPMLSIPVQGQFEQVLNGRWLERLGYGLCGDVLTDELLARFLARIPDCARALAGYAQDGNADLLNKLDDVLARIARSEPPEPE